MSSKMRLMRKMTMPDRAVLITSTPAKSSKPAPEYSEQHINPLYTNSSSTSSSAAAVRMCFSCNTTKTPLWRSGPAGPKSLCNACGIRQMKARRAMAAAASGRLIPADHRPRKISKDEKTSYKGHYEIINAGTSQKKLSIDDRTKLSLSQSSAFHRVFALDEKDAAILLMALSCGHVHD